MNDISVRKDDFSIQITSSSSRRFYVRVSDPDFIAETATISDFLIDVGDFERPQKALDELSKHVPLMFEADHWHFSDLLPSGGEAADSTDPELIRRFDEIKSILSEYFSDGSRVIDNSFIEPRRGKFDGVFVFAKSAKSGRPSLLDRLLGKQS